MVNKVVLSHIAGVLVALAVQLQASPLPSHSTHSLWTRAEVLTPVVTQTNISGSAQMSYFRGLQVSLKTCAFFLLSLEYNPFPSGITNQFGNSYKVQITRSIDFALLLFWALIDILGGQSYHRPKEVYLFWLKGYVLKQMRLPF